MFKICASFYLLGGGEILWRDDKMHFDIFIVLKMPNVLYSALVKMRYFDF